jgi:hypothetical protein
MVEVVAVVYSTLVHDPGSDLYLAQPSDHDLRESIKALGSENT